MPGLLRSPVKRTPAVAGPTALVIDDDRMSRELAAGALEKKGFHVIVARDGFEGIGALLRAGRALALLVVDTEMPGVHGWEVIRLARSKAPRARILRLGRPDDHVPGSEYDGLQTVPTVSRPFTEAELLAGAGVPGRRRVSHRNGKPSSRGNRRGQVP
ncbi:MAG TPA: response regulator [Gemmatimonadales bacterium]|nr:response regulator [Gemmatimonadales bacterium]